MSNVKENFLRYVQIETTSSETSGTCPSTPNQWVLAKMLVDELHAMGIDNARVDDHCYVYATIPAKGNHPAKVGLISHMDTSDGVKGPKHPVIIEHYDGSAITLKNGVVIDGFPFLKDLQGQELIVTSGDSVLGADDKAGVAEILSAAQLLLTSGKPHGTVRLAFTPDEEIGRGADRFDVKGFGADYAYTVDGGGVGELEFENFNAASVTIKIVGNNVHPGTAKGVMVNALSLAARIHAEVPADEAPETTEGYEGFYHLTSMKGSVDRAEMHYIIRDFDRKHFEARKRKMMEIAKKVGKGLHPDCYIELVIEDSYYNMHEQVIAHPHVVDIARQAMVDCDIEPQMKPIRGGTDGAQLSFMGLPCPNLFTGGYNYHGKHEFVTLEGMEKAVQVIVRIAELTAARKGH